MRIVSPTIIIGQPGLLDLDEDELDFVELDSALASAAATATEITILGGFYSAPALLSLCNQVKKSRRKHCRVRIAVGFDASHAIPKIWNDMRQLWRDLVQSGFRNPSVVIVSPKPAHFHTKLFRFLHTTRPVWFVGSANPGSKRHELLVRLSGRHEALMDYVEAVFERATDVEEPVPEVRLTTLRDFFLAGVLCHKPPIPRLFTFDAFHFDPENRERLAEALAGSSGVSHANPTTQGFGFDLRSALSIPGDPFAAKSASTTRIQFRPYSIDTVLGWWMPQAYAPTMRQLVRKDELKRERRLHELGAALTSADGAKASRDGFRDHVSTMEAFLKQNSIGARPVRDRDERFEKFLTSRRKSFGDPAIIERLARSLTLTEMPDIWAGGTAVEEFEASFFDDLAFRVGGKRQPSVVKSIMSWLDDGSLNTADEIAEAFAAAIADDPWTEDLWE